MLVKDVMTTTIVTVSPDNSVRQAAKLMADRQVSGIPVVDDDGRLIGLISEGDLIRRTELSSGAFLLKAEMGLGPDERANAFVKRCAWRVGDVMTPNPVTIFEDAPLSRVAGLMQEHGIKRIPVLRAGKLVGIVSRADLLQVIYLAKPDNTATGDEAIRRSILVRLAENTGLECLDVSVTVTDGIVHFWGKVETEACRKAARVLAERVHGVLGVVEHFPDPPPR
ncbi:putative signal-transduction protein containing cAMP-binding and CBS domains [Rhizobium leguminosarum bv. trifolii WSM2297]|uniref:Putative signal-transduction protein containing cAMP-binding and CBS domains n=1 Tax=Rhizobium leguminosarum bv. trifolii WSM2297 TaxID=754762 RepID=J0CI27_RHILT|nr:CBS domain-containing protein [Rhizobium leguminosarum]EJC83217.1 putative signal-transduction protein containing cAMP-binding and CBS domains [Rhizobium leguminosarum bv. trifolii WSM2297]